MESKHWGWILFFAALIFLFSNLGTLIIYGLMVIIWNRQREMESDFSRHLNIIRDNTEENPFEKEKEE